MKALPIILLAAIGIAIALAIGGRKDLETPRGGGVRVAEPPLTLPLPDNVSPFVQPIEVLAFLPPGSIQGGIPFAITPTLSVVPPEGTMASVVLSEPTFGEQIAFQDIDQPITPPVADSLCLTAKGWKPCGFTGVQQTIAT